MSVLLESLKILHVCGRLRGNRLQSMSCSGGEAALIADTAESLNVEFAPLESSQHDALRDALGPQVALANPLDYHTYIWDCLLYTSPSPRDLSTSRMPSSA